MAGLTKLVPQPHKMLHDYIKMAPGIQVRVLDLSGCHQLTDSGLGSLVWQGRSLTHLHLSSCAELSDRTFALLGQCCPSLQHLGACGCERISDAGLTQLTQGTRWPS